MPNRREGIAFQMRWGARKEAYTIKDDAILQRDKPEVDYSRREPDAKPGDSTVAVIPPEVLYNEPAEHHNEPRNQVPFLDKCNGGCEWPTLDWAAAVSGVCTHPMSRPLSVSVVAMNRGVVIGKSRASSPISAPPPGDTQVTK